MNQRTFNAWIRALNYTWVGQEQMLKGFMSEMEARVLINNLVEEGSLMFRG